MKDNSLGIKIMLARKAAGLSQTELAKKMYKTRQTIASWESGVVIPTLEQLDDLSKILSTVFVTISEQQEPYKKSALPLNNKTTITLPILASAMCGKPDFCNYIEGEYEDFIEVPLSLFPGANFMIKCHGDSMLPDIPPTAYCVVKSMNTPLHNKIMLVKTEDGYTIKKIIKQNDKYELHYLNPKGKIIKPKQIEFIGKIIGIWNKIE